MTRKQNPSNKLAKMGFMPIVMGMTIGMDGIRGQDSPSFSSGQPFQRKLKQQSEPFLDSWAEKSAFWGARHGLGEALDRYFGMYQTQGTTSARASRLEALGIDDFEGKCQSTLTYSQILKLDSNQLNWKESTWKGLQKQVSANTFELREALRPQNLPHFFDGISLKDYTKQTLWEGNTRPVKDLLSGSKQNCCMNLGYTAGIGLMGFSVIKTGIEHYQHWQAQQDGSISSQWRTAYETGKAVVEKSIQSLASWEAAGIGMTIGRALIPVGAFPIGGILIGALFAISAYKVIGKLFPSLAKPDLSKN